MSEISVTVNGSTTINPTVGNGDTVNVTIASTGERGPTGSTGSAGPANTLAIGTVTSGTAAATITGAAPSQTLNLVLQTGATGVAGSKGDTGSQGPQGPAGPSYTLPEASLSTLGGIKVGGGLSIASGVLSSTSNGDGGIWDWSVGPLWAWGSNGDGGSVFSAHLGDGTETDRSSPVQIGASNWTQVAHGDYHTLAIRSDDKLFGWGRNANGQVGDGSSLKRTSPVQVGTDSWAYVSAGGLFSIGIRADGKLFAWGDNVAGQLGDGTTTDRSSPVQVGTDNWLSAACGALSSIAVRSDGKLFSWGANTYGQLGDGTTTARLSPVQVGTDTWTSVSAGPSFALAIRSDGKLFAWGRNVNFQLGDGTQTDRSSPAQVGTDSWLFVSCGYTFSLAIRSDGKLFAWGFNNYGQLGDGTTANKPVPIQVGTSSWASVSGGLSHSLGIRSDGKLFAWGGNTYGQLGDGTTTQRTSPVQVGSSNWMFAAAGSGTSHAIAGTLESVSEVLLAPRRSFTAGLAPMPAADISLAGELLINWADKIAYTKNLSGSLVTVPLGGSYTLPTATSSVLGGIKVGTGLTITDGVLAATGGGSSIVEATTAAGFPATGSAGTLYHATNVRRIYFWDSSGVYVEAGTSGGTGEDATLRALFTPAAPTSVTATAGNAQATVTWTAPSVLAQTPITDYVVQYSSNSGSTWTTFTDGTSTSAAATVTGLTNGTAYTFRVAAVNGVGTGAYSSASSAVTPAAAAAIAYSSKYSAGGATASAHAVSGTTTITASLTGGDDLTETRLWLLVGQTGTLSYTVTASTEAGDGGRLYLTSSAPSQHSLVTGRNPATISDLTSVSAGVWETATSTGTASVTAGQYLVLRYYRDSSDAALNDRITAVLSIA